MEIESIHLGDANDIKQEIEPSVDNYTEEKDLKIKNSDIPERLYLQSLSFKRY